MVDIPTVESSIVLEDGDFIVHHDDKSLAIRITMDIGVGTLFTCKLNRDAALHLASDLQHIADSVGNKFH
jgi:hypothetical protein|tara:strand:+ start:110 stop:319 length:210 start_codon:yes stop_codon:yes gene_type:complete